MFGWILCQHLFRKLNLLLNLSRSHHPQHHDESQNTNISMFFLSSENWSFEPFKTYHILHSSNHFLESDFQNEQMEGRDWRVWCSGFSALQMERGSELFAPILLFSIVVAKMFVKRTHSLEVRTRFAIWIDIVCKSTADWYCVGSRLATSFVLTFTSNGLEIALQAIRVRKTTALNFREKKADRLSVRCCLQ